MWRFLGNFIAAFLFSILGTIACIPIVLLIGTGNDAMIFRGLAAVALFIFVAVLFTPKHKGSFRRGARISAYSLISAALAIAIPSWQFIQEQLNYESGLERTLGIWTGVLPLVALMLIPLVLALILLLVSRQKPAAQNERP